MLPAQVHIWSAIKPVQKCSRMPDILGSGQSSLGVRVKPVAVQPVKKALTKGRSSSGTIFRGVSRMGGGTSKEDRAPATMDSQVEVINNCFVDSSTNLLNIHVSVGSTV